MEENKNNSNGLSMSISVGAGASFSHNNIVGKGNISILDVGNLLSQIIKEHPDLSEEKKKSLTSKLMTGIAQVKDVAQFAVLVFNLFKN